MEIIEERRETLKLSYDSLSKKKLIVEDYSSGSEAPESVMIMASIQNHPSQKLRDVYSFNIVVLIYCLFYDLCFLFMYPGTQTGLTAGFLSLLPVAINTLWMVVPFHMKQKSVTNKTLVVVFYMIEALLFCFMLACISFFLATTINYEYVDNGYFWTDMWLISNIFLIVLAIFNSLQIFTFVLHIYRYRYFMQKVLTLE